MKPKENKTAEIIIEILLMISLFGMLVYSC